MARAVLVGFAVAALLWGGGCRSDAGTVAARVEAVELRASRSGPVASAAFSFAMDGQRYLGVSDVPRGVRRPEVGDSVTVRVQSLRPVRAEIAPRRGRSTPLPSASGHVRGDSVEVTDVRGRTVVPRDETP